MSISVTCQCGKPYTVPDTYVGRNVKCKKCGSVFRVEQPEDYEQPPEEYDVVGGATSYPSDADPFAAGASDQYAYEQNAAPGASEWHPSLQVPTQNNPAYSWVIDQSTQASNSGRMQVDLAKYFALHPTDLAILAVTFVIGVGGALAIWQPAPLIIAGAGIVLFGIAIVSIRGKFSGGDVNPAVVLSANPWRVAVCADMSKGGGERLGISIINAPLGRMTGGPPKVGQRLAAVCLYSDGPDADAWNDFNATIVACGVSNPAVVNRVTASISPGEWKRLDRCLSRLPDRKPGLYKLWKGTANTYPQGAKALLIKGVVVLVCAVPVIAMVANIGKKNRPTPPTQSVEREQDDASSPDDGRTVAGDPDQRSGVPAKPPAGSASNPRTPPAVSAMLKSVTPAKPKPDNNLWTDIVGGTVDPETSPAPSPASAAPGGQSPGTRPAGVREFELVTPDAEPPAPPAVEPQPDAAFKVGQRVEAFWAGKWRLGRVTAVQQDMYTVVLDGSPITTPRHVSESQLRPAR